MTGTRAHCGARHPDAGRKPRFAAQMCNAYLGTFPFELEATGRVFNKQDEVDVPFVGLPCSRCNKVTEFFLVKWIREGFKAEAG